MHHLTQQQQQQQVGEEELAELAEEERALERLLSTADGNLGEDLGAATDGEPSPLLWDVPSAAGLGISGGGSAAATKPDMPSAPGVAARMAVNPYSPGQWHAPAQSPFESNQASAALLHPDRGAADSLPPVAVMMPQPQQQPQLPDGHSQALPGLLSGLVAATAAVTPEQLQREQRVLGAWHLLQQQRLAAARASEAADQAVAELARARLVGTAAASALGRATMCLFCVLASWFAAQFVPPADCPSTFTPCLPARLPACPPACLPARLQELSAAQAADAADAAQRAPQQPEDQDQSAEQGGGPGSSSRAAAAAAAAAEVVAAHKVGLARCCLRVACAHSGHPCTVAPPKYTPGPPLLCAWLLLMPVLTATCAVQARCAEFMQLGAQLFSWPSLRGYPPNVEGPPAVPTTPSADPSAACAPATSPPAGRGGTAGSPASQQPQQPAALGGSKPSGCGGGGGGSTRQLANAVPPAQLVLGS